MSAAKLLSHRSLFQKDLDRLIEIIDRRSRGDNPKFQYPDSAIMICADRQDVLKNDLIVTIAKSQPIDRESSPISTARNVI